MSTTRFLTGITHPEGLLGFDLEGYAYDPQVSEPDRLVFRRKVQA